VSKSLAAAAAIKADSPLALQQQQQQPQLDVATLSRVSCPSCKSTFISEATFNTHYRTFHSLASSADGGLLVKPVKLPCHLCGKLLANAGTLATHMAKHTTCSIEDLAELPFFNETNINSVLIDVPRFDRYLKNIKQLKDRHPNNLIVLQINICSIRTKIQFIDGILKTKNVDVLLVSETFLDEDTPPRGTRTSTTSSHSDGIALSTAVACLSSSERATRSKKSSDH
jgi:phage FluMu protein Com